MKPLLVASMVIITLALVFYSIGVLGEARKKLLEWKHVAWFAAGLLCDGTGTFLMSRMSASGQRVLAPWAGTLMAVSGTAAILLMALHIVLAVVLLKRDQYRRQFHKLSLGIYALWLVSYLVGPLGLMLGR